MKTKCAFLMVLLATFVAGSSRAQGLNLFWNDCSSAGVELERFACDANDGMHVLVASFVAPDSVGMFVSSETTID